MKVYLFEDTLFIPRKRDDVFSFFQEPENLAEITPPSLRFSMLTPGPVSLARGAVLDYTIRVAGTRLHWTTVISEYDPPAKFVDVQLRGPYSFWHHTHLFEEAPEGTLMTDKVRYALPFGPLGRLVHRLSVRKQIVRIFEYRKKAVARFFGPLAASEAEVREREIR